MQWPLLITYFIQHVISCDAQKVTDNIQCKELFLLCVVAKMTRPRLCPVELAQCHVNACKGKHNTFSTTKLQRQIVTALSW